MLLTVIKLIAREAQLAYYLSLRAVLRATHRVGPMPLPTVLVELRCARRLDRLASRLLYMRSRIDTLAQRLGKGGLDEAIDADHSFRDALSGLKEEIRAVRYQLALMQQGRRSKRVSWAILQRAFDKLNKIAQDTYAAADKLQWDIDDHDARFVKP